VDCESWFEQLMRQPTAESAVEAEQADEESRLREGRISPEERASWLKLFNGAAAPRRRREKSED
jgi:hypothetical protein